MTKPIRFTLTQQHIDLVSNMYVDYNDHTETGAPYIDPKRPYGNSDVPGDIADILDIPVIEDDGYMDPKQEAELLTLHRETETALQIILECRTFEPGVFERPNPYQLGWRRIT